MRNRRKTEMKCWLVRTLIFGIAGLEMLQEVRAQRGGEGWMPEVLYEPQMGSKNLGAAPDLAAWAKQPQFGPEGRPLPVTGCWMAEGLFGPDRFVQLIQQGHHVMLTFLGVSGQVIRGFKGEDPRQRQKITARIEAYRPALEFAREHNLPIAIREWNWSSMPGQYQEMTAHFEKRAIPLEQDVRVIAGGEPGKAPDPFGPVEAWREWGAFWFGNDFMRAIQRIYPNPPLVILLDNNEGPKVRSADEIPADYPRLIAFLGGKPPADRRAIERAIQEGYAERYRAMFEAARAAMIEPAWRRNVRFVAYNTLWDTGYIGQGGRPQTGIGFDPDRGWTACWMFDGSMPELYDNDWQPEKTDFRPWSPQTEAMNYFAAQSWVFSRNPDFYWSVIAWDGERPSNAWRGRRSASKTYTYVTRGQRWDFDRYQGWLQFTLWVTRPREFREFRGNTPERHAHVEGTFQAVLEAVDRPWTNPVLRDFWRFGELVPNRDERPWFDSLTEFHPKWVRDMDRWYLLTADVNPPRTNWTETTVLRVFALALRMGEKPNRRWLLYAHAPLGAVPDVTVTVPEVGPIRLESVPKSGTFFLLEEGTRTPTRLIAGGPDELMVSPERQWAKAGETVSFEARVAHAPGQRFTEFRWQLGDETVLEQDRLAPVRHVYSSNGTYRVTVEGRLERGGVLREQAVVWVGEPPPSTVIYDLPLCASFEWEGPWDAADDDPTRLISYRHLPNRGHAPAPVLVGGRFVEDPERGSVLELEGKEDAVWLIRNRDTVMDQEGHPNQTISFWFKAWDNQKRQVLYAQGFHMAGFNIYLHEGRLYAGSWAPVDGKVSDWFPIYGRNFPGHWLSADGIGTGVWHHVALVLREATTEVRDNVMHLYLDGKRVASGEGVRIPRHYGVARLGTGPIGNELLTRFHDGETDGKKVFKFRGRLADFRFSHDSGGLGHGGAEEANQKKEVAEAP